jgi:hypothetical protein
MTDPAYYDEIKQLIRDEIAMFVLKGPGWWNNHDPLEWHRCQRCGTKIPLGQGCPCDVIGNTKVILPGGPS